MRAKRVVDLMVGLLLIALLCPLQAAIALTIRLDSSGPILYVANRVGLRGQPIRVLKFRTMWVGADALGPRVTLAGDQRVTRVGRFLRSSRLDELPQLYNVVAGQMSLVGPRPEDPKYVRFYPDLFKKVTSVRPGITGLTQLAFAREEGETLRGDAGEDRYVREILPRKLDMDLAYVNQRSLVLDLQIIMRTARMAVGIVLKGFWSLT